MNTFTFGDRLRVSTWWDSFDKVNLKQFINHLSAIVASIKVTR